MTIRRNTALLDSVAADPVSVWGPPAGADKFHGRSANLSRQRMASLRGQRQLARRDKDHALVASLDFSIQCLAAAMQNDNGGPYRPPVSPIPTVKDGYGEYRGDVSARAVPAPGFRGCAIEPVPVSTEGFNPIARPKPAHSFPAGAVVRDKAGNRYVVTEARWTAILEQTLIDGPVAYHLGDGSAYSAVQS